VGPAERAQVYAGTLAKLSPVAVGQVMHGFERTYAMLFAVALTGTLFAALARPRPS
jgi:hypothetical protein